MAASDRLSRDQFGRVLGGRTGLGVSVMPDSSKRLSAEESAQLTSLFDRANTRQREIDDLEAMYHGGD